MKDKYSFWQLLNDDNFSKIEIPILQRDYAQGRDTVEVKTIRKKFSKHIILALCNETPIELDFVYGSIEKQSSKENDKKDHVFIPLDGQQRLTTLFLLHWFLAAKEGKLNDEVKKRLEKFSYETRPSAHDFCKDIINKGDYSENLKNEIQNESFWYNDEWNNDPTVIGMLTMLDTFQNNQILKEFTKNNKEISLFDRLKDNSIITFYFVSLEKYGLTEDLYIRMNARGKMLNDFENFKSEFYKIINPYKKLCTDFKDKIEYSWVKILWYFREKDKYIVDKAFMNYLRFVTEMLYFKQTKVKQGSYESFGAEDLTNFETLQEVFGNEDNLSFLIFALDNISFLRNIKREMFWSESICQIIENVLNKGTNKDNHTPSIILYATLRYFYKTKTNEPDENYFDYIRVIRNLIQNTSDRQRRDWARIFSSIEKLIEPENIYKTLTELTEKDLTGFYNPQCEEEIFKAKIIDHNINTKEILFKTEDNPILQGNIASLLRASYTNVGEYVKNIKLLNCIPEKFEIHKLENILAGYQKMSNNDFHNVWGDILITDIYESDTWRIKYRADYAKNNAMMQLVLDYVNSKYDTIDDFVISVEKDFIRKKSNALAETKNMKQQLYIYYILTVRIMKKGIGDFFCNGYNFGFLDKTQGFSSLFQGIDGSEFKYMDKSPIYQTYSSQFRYNWGLQEKNALPPELVGSGRINNPFERLIKWSEE